MSKKSEVEFEVPPVMSMAELRDVILRMANQVRGMSAADEKSRKRIARGEEVCRRAAEEWFRAALPDALAKIGHPVDSVAPRRLKRGPLGHHKYDFIAANNDSVFVGATEFYFQTEDLPRAVVLADSFRKDFPRKANGRKIFGIVCGLVVEDDAANLARKRGLLVAQAENKSKVLAKPRKMRDFGFDSWSRLRANPAGAGGRGYFYFAGAK